MCLAFRKDAQSGALRPNVRRISAPSKDAVKKGVKNGLVARRSFHKREAMEPGSRLRARRQAVDRRTPTQGPRKLPVVRNQVTRRVVALAA